MKRKQHPTDGPCPMPLESLISLDDGQDDFFVGSSGASSSLDSDCCLARVPSSDHFDLGTDGARAPSHSEFIDLDLDGVMVGHQTGNPPRERKRRHPRRSKKMPKLLETGHPLKAAAEVDRDIRSYVAGAGDMAFVVCLLVSVKIIGAVMHWFNLLFLVPVVHGYHTLMGEMALQAVWSWSSSVVLQLL